MHIARACVFCGNESVSATPAVLMPFVAHRALGYAPAEITPEWGLRSLSTGPLYCRCNTLYCPRCHGVFLDQRFDEQEMAALYTGYRGPDYAQLRDSYEPGYAARNAVLTSHSHSHMVEALLAGLLPERPAVLDWGGDDGKNTPFRTWGGRCDVIDISGKPLLPGVGRVTPETVSATDYDLVVLSHVLEHIPAPRAFLARIVEVIKPGTLMYIEIPLESLMAEMSVTEDKSGCASKKRYWHEHVNFFSPEALRSLVIDAGLVPVDVKGEVLPGTQYIVARKSEPGAGHKAP